MRVRFVTDETRASFLLSVSVIGLLGSDSSVPKEWAESRWLVVGGFRLKKPPLIMLFLKERALIVVIKNWIR